MVDLRKNQRLSLTKSNGGTLTKVKLGLGWDAVAKKGLFGKVTARPIDLDASAILFDAAGHIVDTVWYAQLGTRDGSIQHTGDNLTGDGDGDDESINVDLSRVPANVVAIVFTVSSFSGQAFSEVAQAYVRLLDATNGDEELVRYSLSDSGSHTAQIMAKVTRDGAGWSMTALGEPARGRNVGALSDVAARYV